MTLRTGRLPHDPVAVAAAPQHLFGADRPPDRLNRSLLDWKPGMFGNDTLNNCTSVALFNHARGVEWLQAQAQLAVVPLAPADFFAECAGDPPDLTTVHGLVALNVLARAGEHGIPAANQRLYSQYGVVQRNRVAVARALNRLGGLYVGVTLHDRELQGGAGTWNTYGDPGPVDGGHMVNVWTYEGGLGDDATVYVGTWGYWQPVTWAWLEARTAEAYGLVWRQLARGDGSYLDGLTAEGLVIE